MRRNPRYLNGESTEEEILSKFLNNFETTGIKDGMVSKKLSKSSDFKMALLLLYTVINFLFLRVFYMINIQSNYLAYHPITSKFVEVF